MTMIPKHISQIWALPEEKRESCVNLVMKIMSNVLQNPNEAKFRDMNFTKIRKKFTGAGPCLYYLFDAGFKQSLDGARLQFDLANWKMLEAAHAALKDKIENPDKELQDELPPQLQDNPPQAKSPAKKEKPVLSSAAEPMDVDTTQTTEPMQVDEANNPQVSNENQNQENTDAAPADTGAQEAAPIVGMEEHTGPNLPDKEAQAEDAISAEDRAFIEQLRANRDTQTHLSMNDLQGLSREEKLALVEKKRAQFRREKHQAQVRAKIAKDKQRRENIKAQQEAKRKREEYQRKMVAEKKKREKQLAKERKKRIKDKIEADKLRRKKEREAAAKRKAEAQAAAQQQQPPQ